MFVVLSIWMLWGCVSLAGDWPMWRNDAGHTASSDQRLPDQLSLQWTRVYSPRVQVWDDPLNNDLMQYDRVFEPIVKDGRMFLAFNDSDKVVAIDIRDGSEQWRIHADGPVRFAPVAWQDAVFFSSDDGHLYCVEAASGRLRWKFRGAPLARKVIGNERMISAWPARGGPVVHEDKLYFAAGIWPFMGTFIYALAPDSGEIIWVNDSTSAQYIEQPHSAPSFAGVAPQGCLTIVGDRLLVPGGRSVPASFDRHTGEFQYFELVENGKGNGGSFVAGRGDEYYVHTRERGVRAWELATGKKTAFMTNEPVLTDRFIIAAEVVDPKKKDDNSPLVQSAYPAVRAYNQKKELVWELKHVDGSGDLIQAGNRLYAAGKGQITAIELADDDKPPRAVWTHSVDGDVQRLLVAGDMLFAVTLDGRIMAFGASPTTPKVIHEKLTPVQIVADRTDLATELIQEAEPSAGLVLWYGADDPALVDAVLLSSDLQMVVVDPRPETVAKLRKKYDEAGLYGRRISVHEGTVQSFQAPPYVANLVVVGESVAREIVGDTAALTRTYDSVRPYGGSLLLLGSRVPLNTEFAETIRQSSLEKALVRAKPQFAAARRVGALTGAADWTHQYGNIANTVKSEDERVKLPLGVLWFGGTSNLDVLPRHGHGPPEQVVGGRLYIQGMNSLSCWDVYTGRVFWKREFNDLGTYGIFYDDTYKDTPLDPAYNQVHIPGANGRGTNFVATDDGVYIVEGDRCHVLEVETGETIREIVLPREVPDENRQWAFIGVYNDVLLGGAGFANYRQRRAISFDDSDSKLKENSKGFGSKSLDVAASDSLIAFNRHTGKVLWHLPSVHSFLHNGIVAGDGKVFCLDKLPGPVEDKLRRRGQAAPDTYRIVAVDYRTGQQIWEQKGQIFGTWLGYSEEYGLLLHAGAAANDRLSSEVGNGMAVYRGKDGNVVWRVDNREYSGPCILYNDTILTNAKSNQTSSGAFSLLDGSPKMIVNPLTQQEQPWLICRAYGCNNIIASENLLTFRSGAASFYDLRTLSGTGNLGGFKSGCTSNLVVANGVLNAPDYTRTCSCPYQNQTSLALVHMPEIDLWTLNHTARLSKPGQRIERIGVNFGAPGDRMDEQSGTLWLEYPAVGGESADIAVEVTGSPKYFQDSPIGFQGPGLPWVGASGVENLQTIKIPLIISSPDKLQFPIKASDDDAEEDAEGNVNRDSGDLELVTDSSQQKVGLRFTDIAIPQGTKITNAYIQFTCDEKAKDETKLVIAAEDSSHAAAFTSDKQNVSQRTLLPKTIAWTPKAWDKEGRAEEAERTPDLTEVVQELINRLDWQSGNSIAFVITGSGKRIARTYDGKAEAAPKLVITAQIKREEPPATPHTVRLLFAEPKKIDAGQRVFDVALQGQVVATDLDVIREAKGARATLVREFKNVMIANDLTISFSAKKGVPLINGVQIVRDAKSN
jgi:outer membrane protein assembly factor BamB